MSETEMSDLVNNVHKDNVSQLRKLPKEINELAAKLATNMGGEKEDFVTYFFKYRNRIFGRLEIATPSKSLKGTDSWDALFGDRSKFMSKSMSERIFRWNQVIGNKMQLLYTQDKDKQKEPFIDYLRDARVQIEVDMGKEAKKQRQQQKQMQQEKKKQMQQEKQKQQEQQERVSHLATQKRQSLETKQVEQGKYRQKILNVQHHVFSNPEFFRNIIQYVPFRYHWLFRSICIACYKLWVKQYNEDEGVYKPQFYPCTKILSLHKNL